MSIVELGGRSFLHVTNRNQLKDIAGEVGNLPRNDAHQRRTARQPG